MEDVSAESQTLRGARAKQTRSAWSLSGGGADLRIIKQMLGYVSAEMTAIYTFVDMALLREVYAKTRPSATESG